MTDTTIFAEPEQLDHLEAELPEGLLELYEVLEFIEHPVVMTFPTPLMSSPLSSISLPPNFVSRQQWGARNLSRSGFTILRTAQGNTAHYEGPHMGLFDHSTCPAKVRGIQAYHISKGWVDLAYSSVECPHGAIYEGRWYGYRTAANGTNIGNDRSYAHCYLGGVGDPMTYEGMRAMRDVFTYFEARGSGTRRWDHNDWKPTQCSGEYVRRFLKVDNLFVPEKNPPAPTPHLTLLDSVEIDMRLETFAASIMTTPNGQPNAGCGWVRVPFQRKQIKGCTPPGNRPAHDGGYETCEVGFAEDDTATDVGTVIEVTGWAPGWPAVVEFTVAVA